MIKTYAVIGLGYVGLGLALALSKKNTVFGYDTNQQRIEELCLGVDKNKQVNAADWSGSSVTFTHCIKDVKPANFYIVTVSTPAYYYETPDLDPLISATETLASILKPGDIVVYESTVYPGTTEELCIPILEKLSHLRCGTDFNVGYSPERINPGDEIHTLKTITKVVSAQNEKTLKSIEDTYNTICEKTYAVSNIATAEAIKILENTQRDVNIALMNEFSQIMHALHINTHEVIEGAKTKWGFVPYKPGFVGGHCISIDPHYLAFQAKRHGVQPNLILAARKVNDGMTQFVIESMMKLLITNKIETTHLIIGVFGVSYKKNVPDIRNSLSLKLIKELEAYDIKILVHDPFNHKIIVNDHELPLSNFDDMQDLSVAIVSVAHDFYKKNLKEMLNKCKHPSVLMDIPNLFINDTKNHQGLIYWNL